MLLNINYKNWPNIIYVKYNDEYTKKIVNNDETNEGFIQIKKQVLSLIDNIKKFKKINNNSKVYIIININSIKKIDLKNTDLNSKLYSFIIKNIKKYVSKIYIIHNNKNIINIIKFFISLKYLLLIKLFKYFGTIEETQNYINNKNNKSKLKNNNLSKKKSCNNISTSQL